MINILERSKELVCEMNTHEAKKLNLMGRNVQHWPKWAQRDFKLACNALVAVREEAINSENDKD